MEKIREVVGTPGDVLNKAWLFDSDIKAEGEVSAAKIIPILVSFEMKMEGVLVEIRKLLSRSPARSSQAPPPPPKEIPRKGKSLKEVKIPLQQKPVKELVASMVAILPLAELLAATPAVGKARKTGRDSRTPSSEPAGKNGEKVKKELPPELESKEESTAEDTRSSSGNQGSEEKPSIPPLEPKTRMGTRASNKKKPTPAFKIPGSQKRPSKTPKRGKSLLKKPRER